MACNGNRNQENEPVVVKNSISKEFAGYKIAEAEKAETPDKGMFYEVEIEKGRMGYVIKISPEGNVLKKR